LLNKLSFIHACYVQMNWLHLAVTLACRQQIVKFSCNIVFCTSCFFFLQKLCAGLALEDQMYV